MATYDLVTSTGVIVPDTADTLGEVQAEWRGALGDDLSVSPDTPQGVLIVAETLARDAVARNNAALANQINPNLAGGVFLDAIWALTGGGRVAATRSTVTVTLAGQPGTIIPAAVRARIGTDGALFETTGTVILDATGLATAAMQSVDTGPIAADVGALDTIVTSVLGWETVSNPAAALPGRSSESDQAARARRRQTLALQGVALPEAVLSAVYATEGVRSAVFRENVTPAAITIDGQTLAPHSIYVAVDGGTDAAVARALLANKSLGAGWNGNTTVTVVEPASGQPYDVTFQRPVAVPLFVRVTVSSESALSDPVAVVKEAIVSYATGVLADEPGFTIGTDVSAFELAGAINRVNPPIFVRNVELSTDGTTYGNATIPVNIGQIATVTAAAVQVVLV